MRLIDARGLAPNVMYRSISARPLRPGFRVAVAESHRVLVQRRVDVDLVGGLLHRQELLGLEHHPGRRHGPGHPLDDHELLGLARISDEDLEHEPVDLGLRSA
jgi:hypothetical protein